ncbi:lysylphosphatidylglycerol synthase domain-containing protein [Geodermatophilus sp. DF01_2]|uniref:lysylphosphatidylglycerol synthase domain-containing protein n=1 Tax=Geodermatophilus sp. DF01-2 TaxID=2559610 RepID=UPI001ADDDBD7|nr:lysylphosphatidylglycerol synthase domain-containing protein [Geodermatophilus sp. DF01_2]
MAIDTAVPPQAAEAPSRSHRALLLKTVRAALAIAIAASIVYAVIRLWPDVRDTLLSLNGWTIAASFAAALGAIAANVKAWQAVLRELDHEVATVEAGQIYLVGQLGKYLPGSVWAFVLQMELSLRAGIPRARSFAASLVLVGLSTTAALVLGLLGVPTLVEVGGAAVWGVAVLVPIALVCAIPPVLSRLVDLFLRILGRAGLGHRLRLRGLLRVLGWSALAWTLFGVHFYLLGIGAGSDLSPSLTNAIGSFALAMTAGLLAVASPSGLGVREAVLVASLSPFGGVGTALGVALASRLILTVADVLAAGTAAWSARGVRAVSPPGVPQPTL